MRQAHRQSEKVLKSRAEMVLNKLFYERHKLKKILCLRVLVFLRRRSRRHGTIALLLRRQWRLQTTFSNWPRWQRQRKRRTPHQRLNHYTTHYTPHSDLLYSKRDSFQSVTPAAIFMKFYDRWSFGFYLLRRHQNIIYWPSSSGRCVCIYVVYESVLVPGPLHLHWAHCTAPFTAQHSDKWERWMCECEYHTRRETKQFIEINFEITPQRTITHIISLLLWLLLLLLSGSQSTRAQTNKIKARSLPLRLWLWPECETTEK